MDSFPAVMTEQEMASVGMGRTEEEGWPMVAPEANTVIVDGIFSLKNQGTSEPSEAEALLNQLSWKLEGRSGKR